MSKAFICGFAAGLALLAVVGVGAARLHQRDRQREAQRAELTQYDAELPDATPVQPGALTEKQRIHSEIYSHYSELRKNDSTISDLAAQAKGKSRIVGTGVMVGLMEGLTEAVAPERFFAELAQLSDLVVRGRVTNKVSAITEDDSFIFTDHDVLVTEVLKNNALAPLNIGSTITVTRPGGKVLLDGIIVKAQDDAFAPLSIGEHDYLLFLRLVPGTGAYETKQDTGSFEIDGLSVRPLTGYALPPGVLRDSSSFLQTVRAVSKTKVNKE